MGSNKKKKKIFRKQQREKVSYSPREPHPSAATQYEKHINIGDKKKNKYKRKKKRNNCRKYCQKCRQKKKKKGENKLKAKELLSDMSSHLQFFAIIPSQWKMEIVKTNARTQYDNNNDRDNG